MDLIKKLGGRYPTAKSKQEKQYGLYKCPGCQRNFEMQINNVNTKQNKGEIVQCKNCAIIDKQPPRGLAISLEPLYARWKLMHARCYNSNNKSFDKYGARGIKVNIAWHSYKTFKRWFGPDEALEIHRIDNDADYSEANCQLVTATKHRQIHGKHYVDV